jgi:hypothetical protein
MSNSDTSLDADVEILQTWIFFQSSFTFWITKIWSISKYIAPVGITFQNSVLWTFEITVWLICLFLRLKVVNEFYTTASPLWVKELWDRKLWLLFPFPLEKLNTKTHAQTSAVFLRTVAVPMHVITCYLLLNKGCLYEYIILVYSASHGGPTRNVHRKFLESLMLSKATLYTDVVGLPTTGSM